MCEIQYTVRHDPISVIATAQGQSYELPALWLRERCQDEDNLDHATQQRLFNPHNLPEDLALTQASFIDAGQLSLVFTDGYSGLYDTDRFLPDFDKNDGTPEQKAWKADIDKSVFKVQLASLDSTDGLIDAIDRFITYGLIIIKGVPNEADAILRVAEKFGHVRTTNFGPYFEVYSRPNSNDLAYRSVSLAPHTDNPYRSPMPGIQLLHCLVNETSGGLSTLVDSLAVLKQLKEEDPEGFELLAKVPVRYRHVEREIELVERQTVIQTDYMGRVTGVTYSPRLDYLPLLSSSDTSKFHRARKRLGQLLSDPAYEWKFRLEEGEIQMFHNTRVLHGRTGFDTREGNRHLQGCYIDIDTPKGIYRALKRKLTQ